MARHELTEDERERALNKLIRLSTPEGKAALLNEALPNEADRQLLIEYAGFEGEV